VISELGIIAVQLLQYFSLLDSEMIGSDCTSVTETYAPEYLLPIAAGISYISYAIIFYLYFVVQVPAFQRHPTG
jgi:hypothetical protein